MDILRWLYNWLFTGRDYSVRPDNSSFIRIVSNELVNANTEEEFDAAIARGADLMAESYTGPVLATLSARPLLWALKHVDDATLHNMRDNRGGTLLHMHARSTCIFLVREAAVPWEDEAVTAIRALVARGCDVNASNTAGETPLHAAGGNLRIIHVLLELGADPHARDNAGETPLDALTRGDRACVALRAAMGCVPVEERLKEAEQRLRALESRLATMEERAAVTECFRVLEDGAYAE